MTQYLNRTEAAAYLRERGLVTTKGSLQKYATVGGGPEYQIFAGKAVMTREALDAWAAAKLGAPRRSTSDTGEAA